VFYQVNTRICRVWYLIHVSVNMKDMKALLLIFSSILAIASCDKPGTEGPGIMGKWVVKSSYMDIGNGSGSWKNEKAPYSYYLFKADSTVETGTEGKDPGQSVRFSILDSARIRFDFTQGSMVYRYTLGDNRLTLSPPCIEGCGMRLERP
jgi:hypothetical protein